MISVHWMAAISIISSILEMGRLRPLASVGLGCKGRTKQVFGDMLEWPGQGIL